MNGLGFAVLLLMASASFGAVCAEAPPSINVIGVGEIEPVFLWKKDRCDDEDVPDTPLRAVRLDTKHLVAFSSHEKNRRLIGADFAELRRDCQIVFSGEHSDRAGGLQRSGLDLLDLVGRRTHNLRAGPRRISGPSPHPGRCRFSTYMERWYNAIVLLRSDDAGHTFSRVGERPVASIPIRQDVDQGHNRGFFEPTNIVKRGGAYFALIRAGPEVRKRPEPVCFARTI